MLMTFKYSITLLINTLSSSVINNNQVFVADVIKYRYLRVHKEVLNNSLIVEMAPLSDASKLFHLKQLNSHKLVNFTAWFHSVLTLFWLLYVEESLQSFIL